MPTTRRRTSKVAVQYAVPRRGLPGAAALRRWASVVSSKVLIRVVGAREGRLLSRQFRKKNRATNVLTFHTGDVVLCAPVVRREARAQGKTLAAHYAHLVVHGALHFRGYDHVTKKGAARMEREEIRLLRRLGFDNPYEVK